VVGNGFFGEGVVAVGESFAIPMRFIVVAALVVVAAAIDIKRHRIPNGLVFFGALVGCALQFAAFGWGGVMAALGGMGLGLVMLAPLYLMGAMGAGDVKLLAMVGSYLGAAGVFAAALLAFVAGGVLAVAVALRHRALGQLMGNVKVMVLGAATSAVSGAGASVAAPRESVGKLPYAVAIALGTGAEIALEQMGKTLF
jgi:prepilin peptidase CpaA